MCCNASCHFSYATHAYLSGKPLVMVDLFASANLKEPSTNFEMALLSHFIPDTRETATY